MDNINNVDISLPFIITTDGVKLILHFASVENPLIAEMVKSLLYTAHKEKFTIRN